MNCKLPIVPPQADQPVAGNSQLTTKRFWLIWGAIIGIYGLLAARCLQYSIDDFYIILRYVQNAVDGHGLVYNVGERVEGYTCFSWVVLLVSLGKIGLPLFWTAKLVGVAFGAAVLWLTYLVGLALWQDRENKRSLALIPVVLTAVNPVFVYWSAGGLETALYSAAVMAFLYLLILVTTESGPTGLRIDMLLGCACAIAALTRPEGLAIAGVVLLVKVLTCRSWRGLLGCAVFAVSTGLPILAQFCWRFVYYGDVLPNTFYAKTGGQIEQRLLTGRYYMQEAIATNMLGWLGPNGQSVWPGIALLFGLPMITIAILRRKCAHVFIVGLSCLLVAITVWEGGDWMPWHRFVAPLVPLWMLAVIHSISRIGWRLRKTGNRFIAALAILGLAFPVFLMSDYIRLNRGLRVGSSMILTQPAYYEIDESVSWSYVFVDYIKSNGPTHGSVALSDIGYLGYKTDYRVIDMAGLVDRWVARAPGSSCQKDYDMSYVLDQKPDFIVLTHCFLPGKRLASDPVFRENYVYVDKQHYHSLYERKRKEDMGRESR